MNYYRILFDFKIYYKNSSDNFTKIEKLDYLILKTLTDFWRYNILYINLYILLYILSIFTLI